MQKNKNNDPRVMGFILKLTAAKQRAILLYQCKLMISDDISSSDCWRHEKAELSLNANEH